MRSTDDRVLYARLVQAIGADGVAAETADGVVLVAFEGRPLPWSMRLHVTPGSFGQLLRDAAPTSAAAFPDVEPIEAAWRLFLVHLDEAIQTARPGESELVPAPFAVASLRPDMTRHPSTPEVQENHDDQRRYDELIEHFADRGRVEVEWEAQTLVIWERDGRRLARPVRLRVPFHAVSDRLRRDGAPDDAWTALVTELTTRIEAGWTDIELRDDGSLYTREQ